MAKLTQEQIDSVPGLAAAQRNGNVTFLNMDTDETSPRKTAGFTDQQIIEMDESRLKDALLELGAEEERIAAMQRDVIKRRNDMNLILHRRAELT